MKHSTLSFEEVLAELIAIRARWQNLGYNLSPTRIGRYEQLMRELVTLGPEGRTNFSRERAGATYLILGEISEFLFASRTVLDRTHLSSSARIRQIFSGPDLASGETDGSSGASRNALFELTVAAAIERAGLTADISSLTDVRTQFQGVNISIECKRPQTINKAETAIRNAAKQLEKRSMPKPALGLIAICIGRVLTGGTDILISKNRASLGAKVRKEADDFISNTRRFWKRPAVTGIIARINIVGIDEESNKPYHVTLFTGTNREDLSANDAQVLKSFMNTLETGLPGETAPEFS